MSKNDLKTQSPISKYLIRKSDSINLKARAAQTIRRIKQQIKQSQDSHVDDQKNPHCCDHRYVRNVLELKSNLYLVEPSIFTYPQRQFQDMKILNARSQADEDKKKGAQEQREQLRKMKEDFRKEEEEKVQKIMDQVILKFINKQKIQINKEKFSKVRSHIKLINELPSLYTESKNYSINKLIDRLDQLEEQKEAERSKVLITHEKEKTDYKTSTRQENFSRSNKSKSAEVSKINVSKINNTKQLTYHNQESKKQLAKSYMDIEKFITLQKTHRVDVNEATYMVKNLGKPFISDIKNEKKRYHSNQLYLKRHQKISQFQN